MPKQQDHVRRANAVTLVLGATGRQGGAVARALTAHSKSVRAMVRDPTSTAATELADIGVDVVHGDLADAGSVRSAMTGIDHVFSVQPNSGSPGSGLTDSDEINFAKLVVNLAVEVGIKHLVYSSASIISQGPTGIPNLDCKLEIEKYIRDQPISWTIVRPATFMELLALPDFWSNPSTLSFFAGPQQAIEFIASDDIGRIVASIFDSGDRAFGRFINIAGDEITGSDIQRELTEALGRPITYRRFPDALLEQQPSLARTVQVFEEGRAKNNANLAALADEFGRPIDFKTWLASDGKLLLAKAMSRI